MNNDGKGMRTLLPLLPNGEPSGYLVGVVEDALMPAENFTFVESWTVESFDGRLLVLRFLVNRPLSKDEEIDTLSVASAEITAAFSDVDCDYTIEVREF